MPSRGRSAPTPARPRAEDVQAATLVRPGAILCRGDVAGAKRYFRQAVELCPEKWNYRRQSMMLDPEQVGQLNTSPEFWAAVDALATPTYPPAELTPAPEANGEREGRGRRRGPVLSADEGPS